MIGDVSETLESVKNTITERLTARTAYSEPVTHDGVTVIPVARVMLGFGAGSGLGGEGADSGIGGGGGAGGIVQPLGYIEVNGGGSRWVPLEPSPTELALRGIALAAVLFPFGGRRFLFMRLLMLVIGQAIASRLAKPDLPSMPQGISFGRGAGNGS